MVIAEQIGTTDPRILRFNYTTDPAKWTLVEGDGLRSESRSSVWETLTNLTETVTVTNANNELASLTVEKHRAYPWGRELVERTTGSGTSARTSLWTYYEDGVSDGASYGQVRLAIEPTGRWERYKYDQFCRLTNTVAQFGNNGTTNIVDSENRVTSVSYNNNVTTTIEKLLGREIARTYVIQSLDANGIEKIQTIQCGMAGAGLSNPLNLTNIIWQETSGDWNTLSNRNADGTMTLYAYYNNYPQYGQKTTVTQSGVPDGAGGIADGTKTTTIVGQWGEMLSSEVRAITGGSVGSTISSETYSDYDELKRSYKVTYLDGTSQGFGYNCCGLKWETNRDGTITQYFQDALKRQIATRQFQTGLTVTNVLDANGKVLVTIRNPGEGQIVQHQAQYDLAGELTRETNALGGVTIHTNYFDAGYFVKKTINPDGGTRIETYFQDGQLQSVTGTAQAPMRYEYGVEQESGNYRAYTKVIKLDASYNDTSEWTKTYTDMMGREYKVVYPDSATATQTYNNLGQLEKTVDPDGVTTLYTYNALGQIENTILDMNRNGSGNDAVDRITRQTNDVFMGAAGAVQRSRIYQRADNGAEILVSEQLVSVSDNTAINRSYGLGTTNVTSWNPGTRQRTVTTTHPDGSQTVTLYTNSLLARVTRLPSGGSSTLFQTDYAYEAHGRLWKMIDGRNGATTYDYNAADLVVTNTTSAPAPDQAALVTKTFYDQSLRATNVVHADNTSTKSVYFPNGLLHKTWGSRVYPVEYAYDHAGRMTNMTTWQNFNQTTSQGTSGGATTTWIHDSARGWLNQKRYADTNGPSYTYTLAGRLASRTWVRGITTWYTNNNAGELERVWYSDGTPGATNTYDRRGRLTQLSILNSQLSRTYNDAGQLLTESFSGGPLSGLSVTNGYDSVLRRTAVGLASAPSTLTRFGYDEASRLSGVTNGSSLAIYSYLANSPLVENIVFKQSGTMRMTTTKSYDNLNRLTSISSAPSASSVVSFNYAYNSANQRTGVTNADNSRWVYDYDSLGQVKFGKKYWSDGVYVAGQQFEYVFDDIGNRKATEVGGGAVGSGLRHASYTANTLNQYTSRDVPGYLNIMGEATNTASVTVNDHATYRKGSYYRAELAVTNSSGPIYLTVTNLAVQHDGSTPHFVTNVTGSVLWPGTPETFTYDEDGNLTSDSLWTNTWNGENRRTMVESRTGILPVARMQEQWSYLPDGRWIERIVSTNNGTSYYPAYTNRYVWDGPVLLAVLDHTNGLVISFVRGLDLSGTMQGAGGVGGLLAVSFKTNGTHFVAYDGNGNVTALATATDGSESARYEYGPFGEPIRMTGPVAKLNPIRFSTQYADDATGDTKYLYRDYDSRTGRWLSRDPIEEEGGIGLYAFVHNAPLAQVDPIGWNTGFDIAAKYAARFALAFSQPWIGIPLNLRYRYYWFADDGVVKALTDQERDQFYYLKVANSLSGNWRIVNVTDAQAERVVNFIVEDNGTWTSWVTVQPLGVSAKGSIEARRCGSRSIQVRNKSVEWTWFDEMDANSWKESQLKGNHGPWAWIEGLVNVIGDNILRANFNFDIDFTDDEKSEYTIYRY
jgi:RHS repeat-associated protein